MKNIKYPEQKHGYKNCAYHCMICQQVYYPQINKWLDLTSITDAQVEVTTGIFHERCLEDYFKSYIKDSITEKDKEIIRNNLEERLQKLTKKVL